VEFFKHPAELNFCFARLDCPRIKCAIELDKEGGQPL